MEEMGVGGGRERRNSLGMAQPNVNKFGIYGCNTHTRTQYRPPKLLVLVAVVSTDVCLPLKISADISAIGSSSTSATTTSSAKLFARPGDTLSASRA